MIFTVFHLIIAFIIGYLFHKYFSRYIEGVRGALPDARARPPDAHELGVGQGRLPGGGARDLPAHGPRQRGRHPVDHPEGDGAGQDRVRAGDQRGPAQPLALDGDEERHAAQEAALRRGLPVRRGRGQW